MRAAIFLFVASILTFATPPASAAAADTEELRLANEWNGAAEEFMNRGEYEEARKLYLRSLPLLEKTVGPEETPKSSI
jgi:hypothetical protein